MEFIFSTILAMLLLTNVSAYSLTNATDSVSGCSHNNTRFANGSFVPTMEPCLSCKCLNANLICALRVCPEQAFPPPRGCVIVQRKNDCCPYMTCSKIHSSYKDQEKKVITHDRKWYEQNIRNRIFSQNALQRRIEESDDEQQLSNGKMCVYNGTVYRSGSAMTTSSLCTYCYCIEGKQKCVQPKCTLPAMGCEPILIDSSCCPIRYDCTDKKAIKSRYNTKYNRRRNDNKHYLRMTSRMQRSRGCLVNSTFYPEGHKLPANQTNPCEICFCIGGSKRCAPKKCAPIIRNCRPIIPDGQCCPSSYDCNLVSDHKTARELAPRQYSDFFSLLFGDEDKENSTASWDYETETESISTEGNATNEKGFFDAIKESLNYVDGNKQNVENKANTPNQTVLPIPSIPTYNVGDEDDEEISLLDFFLKGESTFTSTTEPFKFNITSKPLPNGMTNSLMQIQPILPDEMKNESLKFSMLPVSLYNMVKEDGSLIFDEIDQTTPSQVSAPWTKHSSESSTEKPITKVVPLSNVVTSTSISNMDIKTSTTPKTTKISTKMTPPTTKGELQTTKKPIVKQTSTEKVVQSTSQKISQKLVESKNGTNGTIIRKTSSTQRNDPNLNTTRTVAPATGKIPSTTTRSTSKEKIIQVEKATPSVRSTTKAPPKGSTVAHVQSSTAKLNSTTIAPPRITAVQINLNPSILESEPNYDYPEPTLPPSLPNLKIIPFLPTDAVKNVIHKNDGYKSNYNYYQPSSVDPPVHVGVASYPQFNKPTAAQKYPLYSGNVNGNVADDRIDYDSYKMPAESVENIDYINIYPGTGNLVQPTSFQMSVSSKLDYESSDKNTIPQKVPTTPNRNLTMRPPLPPFEPEHEYNLYNLPAPRPTIQLDQSYNEHHLNEAFSSEHNYNVPNFVTLPPMKKPPIVSVSQEASAFSYGIKTQFVPPEKTEGGFVPKRPSADNYIPLHGANHHVEQSDIKLLTSNLVKNPTPVRTKDEETEIKSILDGLISTTPKNENISTDMEKNVEPTRDYSDTSLGIDILEPYDQESVHSVHQDNMNNPTTSQRTTQVNMVDATTSTGPYSTPQETDAPSTTTSSAATSKTPPKSQPNNLTNNTIPLKLITILNNTKKEDPTKIEIPQRKNNKIIDPTNETLQDNTSIPSTATEMIKPSIELGTSHNENHTILHDVFLSSLNRPSILSGDSSEDLAKKSPMFLTRPINKIQPSFISTATFPGLNTIESKHSYKTNPIRSELDLIVTELNKNKQTNDFSHTNNFNSENYQVLPADETNIANTESYVVNNGETKIFTPPHKDPAGLLKLAGCNIYGRMYRVGRIIAELSSSCLECRCTEVGVSCTPLNC